MQFLNLFKKGGEEEKKPVERVANVPHPDLPANSYYALPNQYAPVEIGSQGVSCHIEYRGQGEYYVTTRSKGRIMLQESLNARDRKKLFVSSFDFKGLVGVHLHPAGMVFTLDEEKNAKGEVRPNQPPATILSAAVPENEEQLRAGRIMEINLAEVSAESPLLIASNNRLMHLMIKPVSAEGGAWGLYLSNSNGIIRANTLPSALLQPGGSVVVDRQFFIRLAASPEASITARAWNVETLDPVLMRLSVNAASILTIEELFTSHGLSVVVGEGAVTKLGLLGDSSAGNEEMLRNQYAETLAKLRDRTHSQVAELGQEGKLQAVRDQILAEVKRALRKESSHGVLILAMELAIKEVLAPLYNEARGSDQITSVDHETVKLLNGICNELIGWLQTDSSVALSASAINTVLDEIAGDLPMPGLLERMKQALPQTKAEFLEEEQIHFEDLTRNAKTFLVSFLTSSAASRDVFHLAKQMGKGGSAAEQKKMEEDLEQAVRNLMRETMMQTLIRLVIRGHVHRVELEKRKAMRIDLPKVGDKLIGRSHLDDMIKRYNDYARFLDAAYQERLQGLVNEAIKGFQDGTSAERSLTVNSNGFISYLVMLRNAGGNMESIAEGGVPAITCLHSIPDAVPDIHVEQPDRAVAKGFVRVVHREGLLMEAAFAPKTVINVLPEGVPEYLWAACCDLALRYMEYNLAGDGSRKSDRQQHERIAQRWSRTVLLKFYNLLRAGRSQPAQTDFAGFQEFLQEANGVVEVILGEESGEELLDLRGRPQGMREAGLDVKKELRQAIVALQKEGVIKADGFRFKQKMGSFALSGGSGRTVEVPMSLAVRRGAISIEATFAEKLYKRVFAPNGEEVAPETEVVRSEAEEREAELEQRREQSERLKQKGIAHSLRTIEFFKDFSEYEKDRVAEFDVSFRMTQPQEIVIREGTADTAFYVLLRGRVAAIKGDLQKGKGKQLFELAAGEIIGELAFLTATPRTLNIVALDRGLLLRVDSELLNRLGSDSREKFKDQLINKLVHRLAETTDRLQKGSLGVRQETMLQSRHAQEGGKQGEVKQLSREETIEKIDRIEFFGSFSTFEKRRITAFNTSFLTFAAGRDVIFEGDIDTSFYILLDGRVEILKGESAVVELGPGEFFGDMAFLTSLPRSTGVRSKTEILVMQVDQGLLKRLGSEIREKIKDRFIKKLCERLIQTTGLVV
ncbi:cyclic nucleotide-binding domain-containing protein [Candidatus Magnetaquicoccus inordinatus]|uniref:cyclic nucleotide-binding domain-containing protein n=1 Tax=Candidatus Magnetaquicoccus inordinatus TaxID=2496818 RepID=UPI00102CAE2E|nr:cyclic nucleotide-binding domain-containing protein [Candidatus Magnetaquicoccus inordinatus]